jgi:hypothetical protein
MPKVVSFDPTKQLPGADMQPESGIEAHMNRTNLGVMVLLVSNKIAILDRLNPKLERFRGSVRDSV